MSHTVLVIDDSSTARKEVIGALRKSPLFSAHYEAANGNEALKVAARSPVDLILCDVQMPRADGFAFLKLLKSQRRLQDIPVLMLTVQNDRDTLIRGLENGAFDYILKPFHPSELIARVRCNLNAKLLRDRLRLCNEALKREIKSDPLTRLYNRRGLNEALHREFKRSERTGAPLSVVMADIDHFKKINDTYGHPAGDRVLQKLADLIRENLRPYDTASRYGGEEFTIVTPHASPKDAYSIAERLRLAAARLKLSEDLAHLRLTVSFGVATYPHPRIHTVSDLIFEADSALLRAKVNGRNRVEPPPC